MPDGQETEEIACGELRWERAIQHAGRIACGELRWEGAREHAYREETV